MTNWFRPIAQYGSSNFTDEEIRDEKSEPYVNDCLVSDDRYPGKKNKSSNVNIESNESQPLIHSRYPKFPDKEAKGSNSTVSMLVMIIFSLFVCTLLAAVYHSMGGELEKAIYQDFVGSNPMNLSVVPAQGVNVYNNIPMPVESAGSSSRVKDVKSCNVPAPGEWNSVLLSRCSHSLSTISVKATEEGHWPSGFSWTLMKDGKKNQSSNDINSFIINSLSVS